MSTNGHSAASSRTTATTHVATRGRAQAADHATVMDARVAAGEALATPDKAAADGRPSELKRQYLRFYPTAMALSADQVQPLGGDPLVVLRNVRIGVDAVHSMIDRIKSDLPNVSVDAIAELPAVAGGLVYANTLVRPVSSTEIRMRQARVKPIRKEALSAVEGFVRRGLLPAERLEQIKQPSGPIGTALHTAALADLFIEFWDRLAGKHVLTRDEIIQLGKDGDWLAQTFTPKGARKEKAVVSQVTPQEVRDRFYGLLVQRHSELRRVAAYLWGAKEADRRVPKLTSLVLPSRRPAAMPAEPVVVLAQPVAAHISTPVPVVTAPASAAPASAPAPAAACG